MNKQKWLLDVENVFPSQEVHKTEKEWFSAGYIAAMTSREVLENNGMAACMDMVREELIEAGVITSSIPPMFLSNAVILTLAKNLPRNMISDEAKAAAQKIMRTHEGGYTPESRMVAEALISLLNVGVEKENV